MIDKQRTKFLFAIFSSILAVDVITKWLTNSFIPLIERHILPFPYGGLGVFQDFIGINFSIIHQVNSGAAWGLFPNSHHILLYVRIAVILALAVYLLFFNRNQKSQIPFIFIISGALGNVLDSLFYGHVVDMIFFQFWSYDFPVFNIADSFIFLGVVWLCIINLKGEASSPESSSFNNESKPFDSTPFN